MAEVDCKVKSCSRCGLLKPLDDFHRMSKGSTTGRVPRCKSCSSEYYKSNSVRIIESTKKRYLANRDAKIAYGRKWYRKNREAALEKCAAYRSSDHGREMRRRFDSTPARVVNNRIRLSIRKHLVGGRNGKRTWELLGYSKQELISHLEMQFLLGMSWENYGDWHIDHIVPMVSFEINGVDDPAVRTAWGLPNLRPIWAKQNLQKNSKRTHLL